MENRPVGTLAERLASGVVTLFFVVFGWIILLSGGVSLKGKSGAVSYIDGNAGIALACGMFFFGALLALLLARTLRLNRQRTAMLVAMAVVPPLVFLLWRICGAVTV